MLNNALLYIILDRSVCDYDQLLNVLKHGIPAGIDIVQLRDKQGSAKEMMHFLKHAQRIIRGRIPLIMNDRLDVAHVSDVDGVHLGQNDLPLDYARKILGRKKIIGTSCQSIAHLKKAQKEGADYVGFGSVFKTQTKPDRNPMDLALLSRAAKAAAMPLFAIGGIKASNVDEVLACGITRIAVCREVLQAQDIQKAVQQLKTKLV